jgi:hypothetical protein
MTLQEFIEIKVASATPGRSGWKARRMPHWRREFLALIEAERCAAVEAYWASPEGIAKLAQQRKLVEVGTLQQQRRHMCRLEVGETQTLRGSFNPLQEGEVISGGWIGEDDFFSYSEGTRADCMYVPSGMQVKVLRTKRGCPLSFGKIVVERVI